MSVLLAERSTLHCLVTPAQQMHSCAVPLLVEHQHNILTYVNMIPCIEITQSNKTLYIFVQLLVFQVEYYSIASLLCQIQEAVFLVLFKLVNLFFPVSYKHLVVCLKKHF